jgi:hypothetical protein
METKAQQVQRFVGGLRVAIQDKVSMHPVFTLKKVVNPTTRAKMQLERTRVSAAKRHLSDTTRLALNQGKQPTYTQKVQVQSSAPVEREEKQGWYTKAHHCNA